MKKHILDFVYLFFLYLLFSYIYFRVVLNGLHIIDISLAPYLGIVPIIIALTSRIQLKLKKNNIPSLGFSIFLVLVIGVFYLFLFDYYNYDFLHSKGKWWFCFIIITIIVSELRFYFLSYEQLKKHYDASFGFFKTKDTSSDTDKKIKDDRE